MHFGAVGIFALAVIDSSGIPIPLPGSIVYISLLVLGALYGIWKYRRGMRKGK